MANPSKGLGRGLAALLGDDVMTPEEEKTSLYLPISQVESCASQPRKQFDPDALADLADSIREHGIIQPLTVRKLQSGYYQIIAGERRFRALRLNGAVEVPANIMDADEVQMAEMALVENIQRENLSAIEEAKSYVEIMKYAGINQSQLALRVGKSQSSIANKIRLLNLDEEVQEAVSARRISERHARALLGLDEEKQKQTLQKIEKRGLTVAQTEKLLKEEAQGPKPKKKVMLKGISKSIRIALNTIHQAVSMVNRAGCEALMQEEEREDDVIITIRIPK